MTHFIIPNQYSMDLLNDFSSRGFWIMDWSHSGNPEKFSKIFYQLKNRPNISGGLLGAIFTSKRDVSKTKSILGKKHPWLFGYFWYSGQFDRSKINNLMNSRGLFKDKIHADANSSFLCLVIFAYKVHALNKNTSFKKPYLPISRSLYD